MRLMPENKARTAGERCPHCRRPVGDGVEMCRPAPAGWWCWQNGLIYDPSKFVEPTPDPISPAEQEVIDEWSPKVAEAAKVVDAALVIFTAVQGDHRHTWEQAIEVGVTTVGSSGMAVQNLAMRVRPATESERRKRTKAVEASKIRMEKATAKLMGARRTLQRLEDRLDVERRAARARDREAARSDSE